MSGPTENVVGGLIMLSLFVVAWIFHWLPHEREVVTWSPLRNDVFRLMQWIWWTVWLSLALAGILTGLFRTFTN